MNIAVVKCELPVDSRVLKVVTRDFGVTENHYINLYETSGDDYKNVAKVIFGIINNLTLDVAQSNQAA